MKESLLRTQDEGELAYFLILYYKFNFKFRAVSFARTSKARDIINIIKTRKLLINAPIFLFVLILLPCVATPKQGMN
jgi:hypothetical protein